MDEMELMASVFESAIDSKIIIDSKAKIYRLNRAAEKIFTGGGNKDLKGRNFFGLFTGGSRSRLKNYFNKLLEEDQLHEEIELKLNGEMRVFDINANAYIMENLHLFIFRDITDRVRDREARRQFIAVAGHELKTPLAVISAYTDLLSRKFKDDQSVLAYLKKISEKNAVLSSYIESILDEIRIGTGRFAYEDKEYNFNNLVKSAISEIKKTYPDANIKLTGETTKSVKVDKERISQVIRNFLVNAMSHSPEGKLVAVEIYEKDEFVCVSVQDQGKGIPIREQSSIFKAFYRGDSSGKKTKGGLGLGLYIAKQIVKRYGGQIGVKSKRGKGAKFYFEMPHL